MVGSHHPGTSQGTAVPHSHPYMSGNKLQQDHHQVIQVYSTQSSKQLHVLLETVSLLLLHCLHVSINVACRQYAHASLRILHVAYLNETHDCKSYFSTLLAIVCSFSNTTVASCEYSNKLGHYGTLPGCPWSYMTQQNSLQITTGLLFITVLPIKSQSKYYQNSVLTNRSQDMPRVHNNGGNLLF